MSTPADSSELPTHYGQTTLSGHHVERTSSIGFPQLARPTQHPKRTRPASMHWPPNRDPSHGSSLPVTPTERVSVKVPSKSALAQSEPFEASTSPKLPRSQPGTKPSESATDYFGQTSQKQTSNSIRGKAVSVPIDPRTGREYALPPAQSSVAREGNNTAPSTPRENSGSKEVPTTPPTRPIQIYARNLSFYSATELKRAEAQAQANSAVPSHPEPSVVPQDGPISVGIDDQDHRTHGNGQSNSYHHAARRPSELDKISMRLPWTMWMNSTAKNHFVATIGEFVGTTMFLFLAFAGTQVANIGANRTPSKDTTTNASNGFSPDVLLYISLSFSFSLMVNVWIFFRISGGLFNPAVTLALLLTNAIDRIRAMCLFLSQIVAGIAASGLVIALFPTPFKVETTLSKGTSIPRGLFIEALLTAELVFAVLMLAKEKHKATFIAPIGIGLTLFIALLVGIFYTGGSLNPARSFGPCVVVRRFDKEHWIYWVGPLLGVFIAVGFYKLIKVLEYEMANPGQDADDTKNPHHEFRDRQGDLTTKVLHSLGFDHTASEDQIDVPAQANIVSPEAEKSNTAVLPSNMAAVAVCDPVECRIEQRPVG